MKRIEYRIKIFKDDGIRIVKIDDKHGIISMRCDTKKDVLRFLKSELMLFPEGK